MTNALHFVACATVIGAGATLIMDLWGAIRNRFFGIRPLDMRLLGRWLGHMLRGRFLHDDITQYRVRIFQLPWH
jgi:hypothetical protein